VAEVREALGLPPAPESEVELRERGATGVAGTRPGAPPSEATFSRIWTDTRTLREGDLFVALEGATYDAHDFLSEAASRGAAGAVVHRSAPSENLLPLFPVDDTLVALGDLARYRRRTFRARVVAITGSSGKTTVKDLLRRALETTHRVHATPGNLNNRIGLPLTLLATPPDTTVVVVELGTSEPGEIGILTRIAEPDLGVVTTVSEAHIEQLLSLEGVLEEKLALVDGVSEAGRVVVGDEPPELARRARERRPDCVVTGLSPRADERWRGELVEADDRGRWKVHLPATEFRCGMPGRHGVKNTLTALATAELLGVTIGDALDAIRNVLILDCYNANPQSTRAALELLRERRGGGTRVAVLGSMLELGPRGIDLHRDVLAEALESGVEIVVAVGAFADAAAEIGATEEGADSPVRSRCR
jgi:UDP-N-acetylmuramoyl-tripeptide--D-alanyl-D-alanine ligase